MVATRQFKIKHLSKTFYHFDKTVRVLSDISIDLNSSEITFLCGLNGSGKSTLFKALSGFIKPDNETIISFTNEIETPRSLQKNVLFVPQNVDDAFIDNLFVYEYVKLFDIPTILNYAISINANWIVDLYKFESKILLRELSQGQRQILLLLVLLSKKEKILLFDEVLSSIDSVYSESLWNLVTAKIKQQGIVSCFITHDYNFAYEKADRLIVIYNGSIVLESRKTEVDFERFISKIKLGNK